MRTKIQCSRCGQITEMFHEQGQPAICDDCRKAHMEALIKAFAAYKGPSLAQLADTVDDLKKRIERLEKRLKN